ncbi:transforming growth factor beta-2 proprotein [Anastrepha ludens]|uniref:transforming growth factor beta-2 proprotein n=1 Tax=Anastrepha ludens TaxID=28586 RepID=UPI0023AED7C6|nr:transforming growth factor beta-2 proprotein [Anastrepha ludens]
MSARVMPSPPISSSTACLTWMVNISQREYVSKYREYFQRIHERKRHELAELEYTIQDSIEWEIENVPLHIVSIKPNTTEFEQYSRRKRNVLEESNARDYTDNNIDAERKTVINNFILKHEMTKRGLRTRRQKKDRTAMVLHFELETNINQLHPGDVEEANVRLMVIHSSALAAKSAKQNNHSCSTDGIKNGKQKVSKNVSVKHILNLKVYQRLRHGKRVLLDSREVEIKVDPSLADGTQSQWMQFDVTKAVEVWLREQQSNLGLEVQCDNCQRAGVRILNYISFNVANSETYDAQLMPVLNIIGRFGLNYKEIRSNKYSKSAKSIYHHHNVAILANGRHDSNPALYKHSCHKTNQRCCRHTMEVVFKKLKGFEFIIQPKVFDAGYCHGRCPPRYNPAHHHAMLQSLIWKQNREHAPRPCCAPSKLVELEVLHVDEKDSEKLKISTWTDMRVVECACS